MVADQRERPRYALAPIRLVVGQIRSERRGTYFRRRKLKGAPEEDRRLIRAVELQLQAALPRLAANPHNGASAWAASAFGQSP